MFAFFQVEVITSNFFQKKNTFPECSLGSSVGKGFFLALIG